MKISEALIKKLKTKDKVDRDHLQDIAKIASEEFDNLFLFWVTGLGKSATIMKICSDKTKRVLISHNQTVHIENMLKDAKKHNIDISHFEHILWNSYHKLEGQHFDFIVIDETDYNLEGHLSFLKTVTYDKLILLTGTITQPQLKLLKSEINPFIFKVTLADAIAYEILPEPLIYLRLIPLDDTVNNTVIYKNFKTTEKKASEKFDEDMIAIQNKLKKENELLFEKLTYEKSIELFKKEYQGEILSTNLKLLENRYNLLKEQIECKYSEIEFTKDIPPSTLTGKMNSTLYHENFYKVARDKVYHMDNWTFKSQILLGGKRKAFYETIKNREFVKGNYFNRLKDKRCIFFLNSVEECEKYGNAITFKSTKQNQGIIDKFNNHEIDFICTKKIINRAMSVDDIDYGLMTTFDFSGSNTKQQIGRSLRSLNVPQIIMFIVKGTKEEKLFNEHFKDYGGKIKYI